MDDADLRSDDDFTSYVMATTKWLHREAYRLCGDTHEAEDLAQTTLYRVYRQWERLTERDDLRVHAPGPTPHLSERASSAARAVRDRSRRTA